MSQAPATPRRVVVVDDHAMFRAGVKAEIAQQVDVVGEAGLERLQLGQPEAVVGPGLDVRVEREPLLGFVRDGPDVDHAPRNDRPPGCSPPVWAIP